VEPSTTAAWLVAYLPAGVVSAGEARNALEALAADTGIWVEFFRA